MNKRWACNIVNMSIRLDLSNYANIIFFYDHTMVYDYYQHRGLCWLVCSIIVRLYLPSKRSLKNPLVPRIHCETSSRSAWESVKVLSRPCTVLRSGPYHNCIWREEEENFFPSIHPHAHQGKNPQKCSATYVIISFLFGAFLLVIATCYMMQAFS